MIQRIQTVYLCIVAGLFLALFFLPFALMQSGEALYSFQVAGLFTTTASPELVYPTWALMIIAAIIVLLSFLCIFMYKKRILQMRMCVYNILLMIGFCVLAAFFISQINESPDFPNLKINFRIAASFPFIAMILSYLAIRNIGADEALVRSLERLR